MIFENKNKGLGAILCVYLVLFIVFVTWSSLFEINDFVRGYGKVIPSGQTQIIQHMEGGIITDLKIAEGTTVKQGDVILTINNTDATASLREQEVERDAIQARLLRLRAELNGEKNVLFSEALTKKIPNIIRDEKLLFLSRRKEIKEKIQGVKEQSTQKKLKLAELRSRVLNLQNELKIAQKQNAIFKKLNKSGAASDSRVLNSDATVSNFVTRISDAKQQIPLTESEVSELNSRISEIQENYKSEIFKTINELQVTDEKLTQRLASGNERLDRTDIVSPVDGVVNTLKFNTVGGVIRPGDVIAEIIPQNDNLIIEARISTNDRESLWLQQPAKVKIMAYDDPDFGILNGVLSDISADSLSDENNKPYYRVNIILENGQLTGKKIIFPGMTAEINIITGKKTISYFLLRPLRYMGDRTFGF